MAVDPAIGDKIMRDLYNHVAWDESVRPAVHSADATGEQVDLRGADSATILITIGAIVGTADDASIIIQESDTTTGGDFAAVADGDLLGAEPTALEPNSFHKVGYIGSKRYLRIILDVGTETSVAGSAGVLSGHLSRAPDGYTVTS